MTLHTAARQALDALDKISRWTGEFPDTGRKHEDGSTMSYAFCFGSNGERDFMRQVAARGYDTLRAALSAEDAQPVAEIMALADDYARLAAAAHAERLYGTSKSYTLECTKRENGARTMLVHALAAPTAQAAPATAPAVCRVCNGRRMIDGPSGHPEDAMNCPACEEDEAEQRAEAPADGAATLQRLFTSYGNAMYRNDPDAAEAIATRFTDALKAAAQPAAPAPVVPALLVGPRHDVVRLCPDQECAWAGNCTRPVGCMSRYYVGPAAAQPTAPAPVVPAEPALDWPAMLLLINDYAMQVHDASEHEAASRADISKSAALKALERIRMAMAAQDLRWKALVHELIFAAAPDAPVVRPAAQQGEAVAPLNGIKATMFHDEGAIAQCGHCKRYTLDRRALSDRQPACDCGEQHYWSGSFKRPAPDAQWFGAAPPARQAVALTDADIDKVTISQWGSNQLGAMLQAHRACARAVERASWAANGITAGDTGGGNG